MSGFTLYTTREGDTWSGIAFKAYGNVNYMTNIIEANPYASLHHILPGGIRLLIPVLDLPSMDPLNLPPWKR